MHRWQSCSIHCSLAQLGCVAKPIVHVQHTQIYLNRDGTGYRPVVSDR